jgi:hypothetical protein
MDFENYRCADCGEMLIEMPKECPNCLSFEASEVLKIRHELFQANKEIEKLKWDNEINACWDSAYLENLTKNLIDGLKKLQYASTESSCDVLEHQYEYDEAIHNIACVGCGKYACEGCDTTCWVNNLIVNKGKI